MDFFDIASLFSMLAGTATQNRASNDAAARQNQAISESLQRQAEFSKRATQRALDVAQQFDPNTRIARQGQIETQIQSDLQTPVLESQVARANGQQVVGNVSKDYTAAKATSDLNQLKATQDLARLLSKSTSAARLRQNEAIDLMNAGQAIDQLNNFSAGQRTADEIGIKQAGLLDPNLLLSGQLLSGAGQAGLMLNSRKPAATPAGTK